MINDTPFDLHFNNECVNECPMSIYYESLFEYVHMYYVLNFFEKKCIIVFRLIFISIISISKNWNGKCIKFLYRWNGRNNRTLQLQTTSIYIYFIFSNDVNKVTMQWILYSCRCLFRCECIIMNQPTSRILTKSCGTDP